MALVLAPLVLVIMMDIMIAGKHTQWLFVFKAECTHIRESLASFTISVVV